MKLDTIKKLIALLPEDKQRILMNRLRQIQDKPNGLHDQLELKPKGHITIEEIDHEGNVVGVLADQPNLVVNGAEEIILRAFSGDPKRALYKNRVLKANKTESSVYYLPVKELMDVIGDQNVLAHPPNTFWSVVNDEEFDIEFSYYPNTLYVEEVQSTEPGQKAFKILSKPNASTAPLMAETYSNFTNLFIGIGDGVNYDVPLNDPRLTFSESFSLDEQGHRVSTTVNDTMSFSEKISNFEVVYQKSNKGGQIQVSINGVVQKTIETYDSSLADGETVSESVTFNNLDIQNASSVELKFSGADPSSTTPQVVIEGLKFDALTKDMNGLIHEIENFTKVFDTPNYYDTTTIPPYTVQLEHFPVVPEKVKVSYNSVAFERVDSLNDVSEGKFYVDALHGTLYFNRALTNLAITYEITGEIFEDELVSNLTTKNITSLISNETPLGTVDGTNKTFILSHQNIVANSVEVTLDGNALQAGSDFSVNLSSRTITLTAAPQSGSELLVSYQILVPALKMTLQFPVKDNQVNVYGQDGVALSVADETFSDGSFKLDEEDTSQKTLLISPKLADGSPLTQFEVTYLSDEQPGVPTGYSRQVILKPKKVNETWYALDKGQVEFVAEFAENVPNHNITIREMGLFDGPRADDHIRGYDGYPVKAFSLVRVGESRKDSNTGIRITWTITLLDENGQPFKGGF